MSKYWFIIMFMGSIQFANGQDPVLFSVEDEPVHLSEFIYIYEKTNRENADYSKASIDEYLDLYIKFKLKVHKARDMGLDTIRSLKDELAGYRKQLANTYLIDRDITEELVREAYERMNRDVNFSHILIRVPADAPAEDTLKAYNKSKVVLNRLKKGEETFEEIAKEVSEDETVVQNNGNIGYVTAMLPDGFYNLETAIYESPVNELAGPVRSKIGYHIVKVNEWRPARGEMEVSHILVHSDQHGDAKSKSDSIYQLINKGSSFEELAERLSDDHATANKGGYLGFFGINTYDSNFEEAAFRLQSDGEISLPVRTRFGFHLIKRISRRQIQPFEDLKRTLESKVKEDGRYQLAKGSMIDRIKYEGNFQEFNWDRKMMIDDLGEDFLNYRWNQPEQIRSQNLFQIVNQIFDSSDFLTFLIQNSALRMRTNRGLDVREALDRLYLEFVEHAVMKYEELNLEEKYPEFRALMREYREGILLFEVTRVQVWDRASLDTVGLRSFFESHRENYMWDEKVLLENIVINSVEGKEVQKIYRQLLKKPFGDIDKKFNKVETKVFKQDQIIEKSQLDKRFKLEQYAMLPVEMNSESTQTLIKRIGEIIPPIEKTLPQARGYIIADYQDYLEKEWIESLRELYDVSVNQEVLNSIVK